jgi:hypothetical protein
MSDETEINSRLAEEVARQKQMVIKRRTSLNWILATSLIAAVVVGLGTWFIAKPINRDDIHGVAALGLGLGAFFFGCLLGRLLFPPPDIKCPQCGYTREIPQGHDWLTWECCPGCGLKMSDATGSRTPKQPD